MIVFGVFEDVLETVFHVLGELAHCLIVLLFVVDNSFICCWKEEKGTIEGLI